MSLQHTCYEKIFFAAYKPADNYQKSGSMIARDNSDNYAIEAVCSSGPSGYRASLTFTSAGAGL
jgi:hypothetical protein